MHLITSKLKEIWSDFTEDGRGGPTHSLIVGEAQVADDVLYVCFFVVMTIK